MGMGRRVGVEMEVEFYVFQEAGAHNLQEDI